MEQKTAVALADTLGNLEEARENLENAPDSEKVAAAEKYMEVREQSAPVFANAQQEYDLGKAGASRPGVPQDEPEPLPAEAAPGVPLVAPPSVVIDASNLERYGPLCEYLPKEHPAEGAVLVKATPYAFAAGTAVTTAAGDVGVSQPSRIIQGADGALGVVTQDVFDATYMKAELEEGAAEHEEAAPAAEEASGDGEKGA